MEDNTYSIRTNVKTYNEGKDAGKITKLNYAKVKGKVIEAQPTGFNQSRPGDGFNSK